MRRSISVFLVGAALAILPACGDKTDEGARAAGITPGDTLAFLSVNLEPSVEQKRNLLSIFRRFPGVKDEVQGDFDDARDKLLDEITEEGGLDYAKDVKPWLGKEIAVAFLGFDDTNGDNEPQVAVLVETTDKAKATAALEKTTSAGEFEGQFRVIENFVVFTDQSGETGETATLDAFAVQATKGSGGLADSKGFTTVVDKLADDRLMLAWADTKALFDKLGEQFGDGFDDFGFPGLGFIGDESKAGPVAVDLHAEQSAIVIDGYAVATGETNSQKAELTRSLPVDTLGALTVFDLKGVAVEAFEFFGGAGGTGGDDPLSAFEEASGVNIREDVLSWMEGEIVITAGAIPTGREFPDFALVIEPTDRDKAEAGVTKIAEALAGEGFPLDERQIAGTTAYVVPEPFLDGIQPAMALFDDRFVLANSPAYLETLAKAASPDFASTDSYDAVLGKGSSSDTSFQLVVRIDPIREAIERRIPASEQADYDAEVKANIEPLDAFGISSRRDGDVHRLSMRLTFD